MEKRQIQLTEQDLHFLVEDAVKEYMIQEGLWGGLKNVWQGAKQGNLNVASTYKTGSWASSFGKYEQQVQRIIGKMQQIANSSGNQGLASSLDNISQQFSQAAVNFNFSVLALLVGWLFGSALPMPALRNLSNRMFNSKVYSNHKVICSQHHLE